MICHPLRSFAPPVKSRIPHKNLASRPFIDHFTDNNQEKYSLILYFVNHSSF